MNSPLLLSYSS